MKRREGDTSWEISVNKLFPPNPDDIYIKALTHVIDLVETMNKQFQKKHKNVSNLDRALESLKRELFRLEMSKETGYQDWYKD